MTFAGPPIPPPKREEPEPWNGSDTFTLFVLFGSFFGWLSALTILKTWIWGSQ